LRYSHGVLEIEVLLNRSTELADVLTDFLTLRLANKSAKVLSSRLLCEVSLEHAEGVRTLISLGNFTSSLGVLRMQYETLVKAIWALYAASDVSVEKLQSGLNSHTAKWADNIPSLGEILAELDGKAPAAALGPLLEFKQYSWKPLSSYIHGGIHAISRHSTGYPIPLLSQGIRSSNGLLIMTGMMLAVLSGDAMQARQISKIQLQFADCCPNL
jgi:hypothetical protein